MSDPELDYLHTVHPVFVSVEQGNLLSCGKAGKCALWGQGALRLAANEPGEGRLTDFNSQIVLSGIGCGVCECPATTYAVIEEWDVGGVTGDVEVSRATTVAQLTSRAEVQLAEHVADILHRALEKQ